MAFRKYHTDSEKTLGASEKHRMEQKKIEMPKYSILEITLIENPNFNNLDKLTEQIEIKMIKASDEILAHLKTLN